MNMGLLLLCRPWWIICLCGLQSFCLWQMVWCTPNEDQRDGLMHHRQNNYYTNCHRYYTNCHQWWHPSCHRSSWLTVRLPNMSCVMCLRPWDDVDVTRQAALWNIQHLCPSLSMVTIDTYWGWQILIDGDTLLSQEGATHGEPLAIAYVYNAIAITPLIHHLRDEETKQVWIADDATAKYGGAASSIWVSTTTTTQMPQWRSNQGGSWGWCPLCLGSLIFLWKSYYRVATVIASKPTC